MKIFNYNFATGSPCGIIKTHKIDDKITHKTGHYIHDKGVVLIYHYIHDKLLLLTIYKDGRGYYRNISGKIYTDIGISRKAGEFASEIFKK